MLTKKERVATIMLIGHMYEHYCQCCIHEGSNTKSKVCAQCPIDGKLKELGRALENKERSAPAEPTPIKSELWTEADVKKLIELDGSLKTMEDMANILGRSARSVANKRYTLRKQGVIN